ncbi:MAG: DNA-binding response regulator [Bacteroidales bacterium]|nr:MAG: DNA-binding response regulator [Bacteroidales bacterium]
MKLKCLIVDDEPLAHGILEKYISRINSLELVGKCNNAIEAINFIHTNPVDLIFLDINMPELSGIEMLKSLQHQPKIIITTAYSEFALDGYEFGVSDYLLKPIKFDRFLKAVNRVIESMSKTSSKNIINDEIQTDSENHIFLKQDQSIFKVNYSDILYFEALGNYLQVYTTTQKIIVRETMAEMEEKLPNDIFIRIHKSTIVNFTKIEKFINNHIIIVGKEFPVGTLYKNELVKRLKG